MRRLLHILALAGFATFGTSLAAGLPDPKEAWIRVETAHFTLISNVSAMRTTRIGHKLEQLRLVVDLASSGFDVHSPLATTIYVFRDGDSFRPYNLDESGRPRNWSGYFLGTPDGNYVAVDDSAGTEPFGVIYHEYLHDFVRNNLPRAPLWLAEGLAEFYSNLEVRSGRAEIGRPIDRHLIWLATHPLIPLEELFDLDPGSADYNEGVRQGTIYAQSWALVHSLFADEKRRDAANALVRLIAEGVDSKPAFERALGTDLATIEHQLAEYTRRPSYGFLKLPLPPKADENVRIVPLDRRQVLYLLSDLLAHTSRSTQAQDAVEQYLDAILTLDPAYADAYVGLARLCLEQEDPARAAELARQALALDAQSARAHATYGRALLQQREPLRAREQFRLAIELDPNDLETLVDLGRSFRREPGDPGEGIEALEKAARALPARFDVVVDLVALMARSGDFERAQALLDQTLHRYGDAASIAAAESSLVASELAKAADLDRAGHPEEARERMRRVAAELQDTRLKLSIWTRLASMTSTSAPDELVETFNRGVIAADHGDSHTAITLLEQVIASTDQIDLKAAAETHLAEVRRIARYNRAVGRYNEAVRHAKDGELAVAEHILLEVVKSDVGADLRNRSRMLLREVSRARAD